MSSSSHLITLASATLGEGGGFETQGEKGCIRLSRRLPKDQTQTIPQEEFLWPLAAIRVFHVLMNGWYVRVKFKKKSHTKFFTDGVQGGKEAALEEAIQWRNQKERELGKPRTDRIMIANKQDNNTGHNGVVRTKKWTGARDKDGNPFPNYVDVYSVTWSPEPGVARHTSFSVEKYDEEEARRLAIDLRKRKERQIYGQEVNWHKTRPHSRKKKIISGRKDNQGSQVSSSTD